MKAGYSGSDMGMSGISTLTFSADCYLTSAYQKTAVQNVLPGTRVYFSGISSPQLFLTTYNLSGNILSITASDKLADSDITFTADGTNFTEYSGQTDVNGNPEKNTYHGQAVLDACASKLGLGSCSVGNLPDLYYSEFVGKSVRDILTGISEAAVGVFYAGGTLLFSPYKLTGQQTRAEINVDSDDCTGAETLGTKNITHVYVTDNVYDNIYEYGSGNWYNTVSRKGSYLIGKDTCDNAAGNITATTYYGWKCDKAIITVLPTPDTIFNENSNYLIRECNVYFGAVNITASLGSPAPQINKCEFQDEKTRLLNQKIEAGKAYKNIFIDENNGLTIQYQESGE